MKNNYSVILPLSKLYGSGEEQEVMGGRGWNGIGKNILNIFVYSHNNDISHNMTDLNKNYTVVFHIKKVLQK